MKQKGLWKIIVLLLGCLLVAGWVIWENANEVFPMKAEDIVWIYVDKNACASEVHYMLNEKEKTRLVDMLNQCQWEETRAPMSPYYDENRKRDENSYLVVLNYQPEQHFWRKSDMLWLHFFEDNYLLMASSNQYWYSYKDTSGNYDELLELLDEQHLYCHEQHDEACQQKYGVLSEDDRKQHIMWISAEEMAR